jgi:hypothetical protein
VRVPGCDGRLWPVKGHGASVRLREVAGLVAALEGGDGHHETAHGGQPHRTLARSPSVPPAVPTDTIGDAGPSSLPANRFRGILGAREAHPHRPIRSRTLPAGLLTFRPPGREARGTG